MLKQNNGMKEIFSNNFFVTTLKSYHLLRENDPYVGNIKSFSPFRIFMWKSWRESLIYYKYFYHHLLIGMDV